MYVFPAHLFNPTMVKADVSVTELSRGVALNGEDTIIQKDGGGSWQITYSGIILGTPQMIKKWDA